MQSLCRRALGASAVTGGGVDMELKQGRMEASKGYGGRIALAAGLVLLSCAHGWCQYAQSPVSQEWRSQLEADWEWRDRVAELKLNPSGEIMGAPTWDDATGAVDGKKTGSYGFHTTFSTNPWWHVDLLKPYRLGRLTIYNRNERGLDKRAYGMVVLVSTDGEAWREVFRHTDEPFGGAKDGKPLEIDLRGQDIAARWVRCQVPKKVSFHLDEVEIYAAAAPTENIALGKPCDQSSAGRSSTPKNSGNRPRKGAFALERTGQALDRIGKLLEALQGLDGETRQALREELTNAAGRVRQLQEVPSTTVEQRRSAYFGAMALCRRASLSNPLVDFDRVVFVKRNPGALAHMCDQYFGSLARPGGGLFILEGLRTVPRVRDVIGDRLPLGSFLGPDLSYDGRRIAFAYAQGDAKRQARWNGAEKLAYHIYTINADGSGLTQLTRGEWDDIHPCWLPDGDLVFVSTRRGGQTRCSGRPVPTYTLHRMKVDGSGITRLSCHETHEWHPSVGNDGSLLYTRWDYVDRHTNIAHNVWTCRTDGTGPVAVYGNYNHDRKPWGQWHPRPVPGSPKILAVAGAHHGYAAGSVILIDPRREFDGQSPLERLTPQVAFPEAEGYAHSAYNTPHPLSEDFYLVSYSPHWSTRSADHQVKMGIYLADRFGNLTLLYRDPQMPSQGALPIRARPRPLVYPAPRREGPREGTFLLLDTRASVRPLPAARISALRIVQILPKTTYAADRPKMSVARQISARIVVGEVPVEEDGSAYFRAPAGVPVYFQALDDDRCAVQTMRSITYLQPGETRSCVGCHEPRQTTPAVHRPMAAHREPSAPLPGPEGTRPFSYMRLVQPVLDRHCVSCHRPEGSAEKLPLTGGFKSENAPFTRSYETLARKSLVPWYDSINGGEWVPESTPDKLGARGSKLISMLRKGHHKVKLPAEDMYRLTLWIDLNVPFYGCYEPAHVAVQRAGGVPLMDEILQ